MIASISSSFSGDYFSQALAADMIASISSSFSGDYFSQALAADMIASISSSFSGDYFNETAFNNAMYSIIEDTYNYFTTGEGNSSIVDPVTSN